MDGCWWNNGSPHNTDAPHRRPCPIKLHTSFILNTTTKKEYTWRTNEHNAKTKERTKVHKTIHSLFQGRKNGIVQWQNLKHNKEKTFIAVMYLIEYMLLPQCASVPVSVRPSVSPRFFLVLLALRECKNHCWFSFSQFSVCPPSPVTACSVHS